MKNTYEIKDKVVTVHTSSKDFLIDESDLELIQKYNWHISSHGYPETMNNGERIRVFWLFGFEKEHCDHINGNKLDNRRANLRYFEYEWQNMGNQKPRKNNTTGYQGVYKQGAGYIARLGFKRKRYNLGTFKTPEEAAKARDAKAKELLGEFAYLNFPTEERR